VGLIFIIGDVPQVREDSWWLHPQQLGLLDREFLFGQNPLGLERAQALKLGNHIV
jgi:hypothetical protein